MEDCSDGDLEAFFNAQSQGKRQILVTKEDLVTGIEIEMVLLHELHDIDDRATHFRAKTILRTAFLNHVAHPALLQKYQVPILQVRVSFSNLVSFFLFYFDNQEAFLSLRQYSQR